MGLGFGTVLGLDNSITKTGSVMSDRKQYYYLGSGVSAHRLEQRESTRLAAGQCAEVRGRARRERRRGGFNVFK